MIDQDRLWYMDAVFYEMNIRAYCDSSGDGNGDFQGAIQKLDHISNLGINVIWILPTYPSPWKDGGYDVADYKDVHPDFGTLDDFRQFVDAAHSHGIRVVTDLVVNHTSDQHRWFQEARRDRQSPYRDYYVWSDTGSDYPGARVIFLDYEESNWSYDELAGQYYWHRFFKTQPDLNYDNPAVQQEMFDIVRFWLDLGVDGFRVDAVPYLYEREGTNCDNLPETHNFVRKLRTMVDTEYPGRILIAEANQLPEDLLPYFGDGNEFHMAFHFPFMTRLFMALKQQRKELIEDLIASLPPIPEGTQWLTFLRNHDELTLEMITAEEREWMWQQYAPEPRMKQNLGIRRRLAPLLDNDRRKWLLMHALLLSLPGAPTIYYGDEIGMGDNISLPDRHGCRTPMQWSAEPGGGFSSAIETFLPINSDDIFGFKSVNVAAQERDKDSYLSATRYLLQRRKESGALARGTIELLPLESAELLAYWRREGDDEILCLFNMSQEQQSVAIDLSTRADRQVKDLLGRLEMSRAGEVPLVLVLEPFAAMWLRFGT